MINNLRGHLANAIMVVMKNETPTTPLLGLLRALETDERRQEFAALCNTSVLYLYQLAGCHRVSCRAQKALAIAQASEQMALTYGTPTIDMQTLATMCAEGGCSA